MPPPAPLPSSPPPWGPDPVPLLPPVSAWEALPSVLVSRGRFVTGGVTSCCMALSAHRWRGLGPPWQSQGSPPREGGGKTSPRPTPDPGAPVAGETAAKEGEHKGKKGEKKEKQKRGEKNNMSSIGSGVGGARGQAQPAGGQGRCCPIPAARQHCVSTVISTVILNKDLKPFCSQSLFSAINFE